MSTNSFSAFSRIAHAVLLAVVPHALTAQQCTGGGWGAAADVLGPNGRRVFMDPSTAVVVRDTVHVVGRVALEWFSDTAMAPTQPDSAILSQLQRMLGLRIDVRNRAVTSVRAEPGELASHPVISVSREGVLGVLWSERQKLGIRKQRDSVSRLRTATFRGGRWVSDPPVLPEMTREMMADLAITAAGADGSRVVAVEDAYPRFNARYNEILLAHETRTGWFYRRYLTAPWQRGDASVARLERSGDVVVLGVVSPVGRAGNLVTSWRIPADSIRPSVLPYALGPGTELADLGSSTRDFPRLFAVGGDSVMAVWYEVAQTGVVTTGGAFDRSAMQALILVVQLSTNAGGTWTEVFRRRMDGDVSRPVIIRDGRGGINLFFETRPDPRSPGEGRTVAHLLWNGGSWQQIARTVGAGIISGPAITATPSGLVALWMGDDEASFATMQLKSPRLRIARYEAPPCR